MSSTTKTIWRVTLVYTLIASGWFGLFYFFLHQWFPAPADDLLEDLLFVGGSSAIFFTVFRFHSTQGEELVKKESTRFQELANHLPDIVFRFRQTPKGTFEFVSDAITQITGYTPAEHYANPNIFQQIFHPEDLPLISNINKNEPLEMRWVHKDGHIIYVEINAKTFTDPQGNIAGVEGVVRDITPRHQLEAAYQASEERYRAIFEYSLEATLLADNEGHPFAANPAACEMFGYTEDEICALGRTGLSADSPAEIAAFVAERSRTGKAVREFKHRRKNGEIFPAIVGSRLFTDAQGQTRAVVSFRDVTEQRRIENAMRESEERYRTISNLVSDYAYSFRVEEDNTYTREWSSKSFERITGYHPSDPIVQKGIGQIIYPEDRELLAARNRRVLAGESDRSEVRIIRRDGAIRWMSLYASPIPDPLSGRITRVHGAAQDITERKLAEQKAADREMQFRKVIDASPVPYALNDDQQNITYLNPAFVATFGYDLNDIPTLAEWWAKAYPEVEYQQWVSATWQAHLEIARTTHAPFEPFEVNIRCKNGETRVAIARAGYLHEAYQGMHLVILYDITERKRNEDALRLGSEMMANIKEGVHLTRTSDGTIVYANAQFLQMLGYTLNELIGQHVSIINAATDQSPAQIAGEIMAALQREEKWSGEIQNVRKDGTVLWSQATVSSFTHSTYGPVWMSVHQDITERKQAEQNLIESEAHLKRAQAIAHLGHWTWDTQANTVVWSEEMYRIFGLDPHNFTGDLTTIISKAIHPEDQAKVNESNAKVISEQAPAPLEYRVIWPDQSVHWIWATPGDKKFNAQGQITLLSGIVQDITERKEAEERLRESQERYTAFIAQSFEGISRTEFDNPIDTTLPIEAQIDAIYANAYMAECNPALAAMYHLPSAEAMIGVRLVEAHGGKDNPVNRATFRKFIEAGYKSLNDETVEYDANGRAIWFLSNSIGTIENGYLVRIWGTALEITERKETEEQLRRNEARLKQAQTIAQMGVWEWEVGSDRTYWSNEMFKIYGITAEEFTGHGEDYLNFTHPEDRARQRTNIEKDFQEARTRALVSGATIDIRPDPKEFRIVQPNGRIIWVRGDAIEEVDAQGNPVRMIGVLLDITQRREIEETLRLMEKRYRDLLTGVQLVAVLLDTQGRITFANQFLLDLTGWQADEVFNQDWFAQFTPTSTGLKEIFLEAMASGNLPNQFENEIIAKNGTPHLIRWHNTTLYDAQNHVVGTASLGEDITLTRRIEKQRDELLTRLELVLNHMPSACMIIDPQDRISYWNHSAEKIFGYSRAEVIGKIHYDIALADELKHEVGQFIEQVAQSTTPLSAANPNITKDGRQIFCEWQSVALRGTNGELVGILAMAQDVTERQAAQRERDELFARLQLVLASLPLGCLITNPAGHIDYWNETAEKIFGYTATEVLGKPHYEITVSPTLRAQIEEVISKSKTQKTSLKNENENITKDGRTILCEWYNTPLHNTAGEFVGMLHMAQDITQRKRTETQRDELFQRLQLVLDNMPLGCIITDPDNYVTYWNEAATKIFGYTGNEVIRQGKSYSFITPPETRTYVENILTKSITQKISTVGLNENLTKDGQRIFCEWHNTPLYDTEGNLIGLLGMVQDVTERQRLEGELQKLSLVIEQSPASIVITDLQGNIEYVNPRFCEVTGYTREEAVGSNTRMLKSGHGSPEFYKDMWQTITSGNSWRGKFLNKKKNGEVYWERVLITPITNQQGKITNFMAMKEDITEHEDRERELEAISKMSAALRLATSPQEIFEVFTQEIQILFNTPSVALNLLDPHTDELVQEIATGAFAPFLGKRTPANWGISGQVLKGQTPYATNDLARDSAAGYPDLVSTIHAAACTPFNTLQQSLGVLWIAREVSITSAEVNILAAIANLAANAVHRATLFEEAELHVRRLTALHSIENAVSSSLDLKLTLSVLLDHVVTELHVDATSILLMDADTQTLNYSAGRGFRTHIIEKSNLRIGNGYAGKIALDRRAFFTNHLNPQDPSFPHHHIIATEGFRSYYGVPLIVKGQMKGVLEIFHREPLNPNPEWIEFLEMLAAQAAIAIDNAVLFDTLQRTNTELTLAYDATIEGWASALELRDKETEGHAQRVTEITVRLAKIFGMSEREIVHIRRGALLHDIGKMAVPDSILLKPGPLTPEEWVIMRKHPQYAYDMLSSIPFLKRALDIPYCHHEHWAGGGYPRGLQGEQIPLAARIFTVADVWDALTSERPYHKARAPEDALAMIKQQSGTLLDPKIVAEFIKMMNFS